jgi:hypothetical protein
MPNGVGTLQGTGRQDALAAFQQRALRRSPIPVPGVPQAPAEGGAPPQPSPVSAPTGNGQPGGEIGILKQVTGKITQPEMIEVLIRRLKELMPKKSTQQNGQ